MLDKPVETNSTETYTRKGMFDNPYVDPSNDFSSLPVIRPDTMMLMKEIYPEITDSEDSTNSSPVA